MEFIAPNDTYSDVNEMSLAVRIEYGETSFLFMGDAGEISEDDILEAEIDIDADLLKVGHHGSNGSTGTEFLQAVSPDYAVISCGKDNSYGHPHYKVLERLSQAGSVVYRTDISGNIVIVSDGTEITLSTETISADDEKKAA